MYPLAAPTASAAIITPSITEWGSCSKISRSLHVPGSLSSPLHSTYFGLADCLGTNDPFIPVANPPPAPPPQARSFHLIDNAVRVHPQRLLQRLITVQFEIAINIRRPQAKPLGDHLYRIGR